MLPHPAGADVQSRSQGGARGTRAEGRRAAPHQVDPEAPLRVLSNRRVQDAIRFPPRRAILVASKPGCAQAHAQRRPRPSRLGHRSLDFENAVVLRRVPGPGSPCEPRPRARPESLCAQLGGDPSRRPGTVPPPRRDEHPLAAPHRLREERAPFDARQSFGRHAPPAVPAQNRERSRPRSPVRRAGGSRNAHRSALKAKTGANDPLAALGPNPRKGPGRSAAAARGANRDRRPIQSTRRASERRGCRDHPRSGARHAPTGPRDPQHLGKKRRSIGDAHASTRQEHAPTIQANAGPDFPGAGPFDETSQIGPDSPRRSLERDPARTEPALGGPAPNQDAAVSGVPFLQQRFRNLDVLLRNRQPNVLALGRIGLCRHPIPRLHRIRHGSGTCSPGERWKAEKNRGDECDRHR